MTKYFSTTTSVSAYKIVGLILISLSLLGYIFVSDEFHHSGEFIGVTCILISGIILLLVKSQVKAFKHLSLPWISWTLLISIPIGGILLDNMILSSVGGFIVGTVLAYIFGRRGNHKLTIKL